MIKTREELNYFLEQDKKALARGYSRPRFIHDPIWKFQVLMRKCDYYTNGKKGFLWKSICKYYKLRYVLLGQRLGFSIPFSVFDSGLAIQHYGGLVVNGNAKIGKNCRIHEGVTIGATGGNSEAAIIGDNVFIATGAKIIGNVKIANGVVIGANAVVVKDILEENTTWAGVPARKISNNSSEHFINLK